MPVHVNVHAQSIANINKLIEFAKQQQRVEQVYALMKVHVVGDEQVRGNPFCVGSL